MKSQPSAFSRHNAGEKTLPFHAVTIIILSKQHAAKHIDKVSQQKHQTKIAHWFQAEYESPAC